VRVGRPLTIALDGLTGVFAPDGEFLALYEPRGDVARPVAVFV
jgi:tRNA pseudouridine55 synthase